MPSAEALPAKRRLAAALTGEARSDPARQLRALLARSRANGRDFGSAWDFAWRSMVMPHDTEERRAWREALDATRSEWRRAYEGEQSPRVEAIKVLAV